MAHYMMCHDSIIYQDSIAGTAMPQITLYTTSWCPYCTAAKSLLKKKGAAFEEIDVDGKPELRRAMSERAGGRTSVPQIFIGHRHVGGSDDLHALDARGELDTLLAA
ncbi:Glutaredoxin 3 [Bosea sp. LC85]|nr:Glutaredoxin 3 [Bosea sp. LC85]